MAFFHNFAPPYIPRNMLSSTYKIFEKKNLIIEVHKGIIVKNSLTSFKNNLAQDPKFRKNFNFLVHIKNVTFETTQEVMEKFASFITNNKSILGNRKVAILTNTPEQVVTSTLYQMLLKSEHTKVEIFSTNLEALNFLEVHPDDFTYLTKEIQKLKESIQ